MPPGCPSTAVLAGGCWGGCLYLFCSAGPTPVVAPSFLSLALLTVIPAVYVGLAARPAQRSTGILPVSSATNLLTLALGWTLVEAVLHFHNLFGPQDGLLTASQGEGQYLHWFARLLGYVCTALLVAYANASLVGILSIARLSFPAHRSWAGSPNTGTSRPSQVVLAIQSWTLRQTQPRAPPIPAVAPT